MVLGVLGEWGGCPEHLLVPVGTHIPALGAMLWSPAGAHIPAHIPALIPAFTAFAWWNNQPSFEGLEQPRAS